MNVQRAPWKHVEQSLGQYLTERDHHGAFSPGRSDTIDRLRLPHSIRLKYGNAKFLRQQLDGWERDFLSPPARAVRLSYDKEYGRTRFRQFPQRRHRKFRRPHENERRQSGRYAVTSFSFFFHFLLKMSLVMGFNRSMNKRPSR